MGQLVVGVVGTRFGPVHLAVGRRGVVALALRTGPAAFEATVRRTLGPGTELADPDAATGPAAGLWRRARDEVGQFCAGTRTRFEVPVDLRVGSDWDRRVLEAVRTVPFGSVTSYGRVARMIGAPGAARAVGGAVGRNPIGLLIPCHRVIAGDGSLGGYGGGWFGDREDLLALKRRLLAHEGVALPAARLMG